MKRPKSSFYQNPILQNKIKIRSNPTTKRKKLTQSMSESCVCNKYNFNQLYSKNIPNSNCNKDFNVKNIDIKFNILNNLKKFSTIFNINTYRNKKENPKNKPTSSKLKVKVLKNNSNMPILLLSNNEHKQIYFGNNIENNKENENKKMQLDPHHYFPEDFSLNIYKSTSLYKNRYKIDTCRLKKALKNIYHEENSIKSKNINYIIQKNTIENNRSIKLLKLLKSRKIDRFVNKLLNISPPQKNENSKDIAKNIEKIFITNKNKTSNEYKNIDYDEKNVNKNKFIDPYTKYTNIYNENQKANNSNNFNENINNKNNTTNSATQTINPNESSNNNYIYISEYEKKSLRPHNSQIILNKKLSHIKNYNKYKNCNYKEIKFEMIDLPKNMFLKKQEKMIRPFSASKINSINLNNQNNNIINNINKKSKLIFSLYDPNDKYVQLFEEVENKN